MFKLYVLLNYIVNLRGKRGSRVIVLVKELVEWKDFVDLVLVNIYAFFFLFVILVFFVGGVVLRIRV